MTDRDTLLREIDAFRERVGMSETRFGRAALNDGHFLRRLRQGGNITLRTVERVRAFIDGNATRPRMTVPHADAPQLRQEAA